MTFTEEIPAFEQLPLQKDGPRGNAWGLFGPDDELGRLNLITPRTIQAAALEIQQGVRVSLDWSMNLPHNPSFERKGIRHTIINKVPGCVNDEEITFNTQGSTQWDGFRHFGYQKECVYYNGHTQEEFNDKPVLGIQAWVHKGGVVGRGVLLDFATWSDKHQIAIDPMTSVGITVEQLKAVAEEQGVKFLPGDILFVRTGFTRAYERLSREEEREISQRAEPNFIGIEASCDMLRWLWDQSFAAIAGDQPAMEQCPLGVKSNGEYMIHEWCLAGWGMPIGEMFYLEELAETCKTLNRYSFFISSMPFNVLGGVASPPNAVAVF